MAHIMPHSAAADMPARPAGMLAPPPRGAATLWRIPPAGKDRQK
jgi:hypothetical protein